MANLSRRTVILGAPALAGLAACGANQAYKSSFDLLRGAIVGLPDQPLSRAKIDRMIYATIYVKLGWGPRTLMVLEAYDGPDLRWVSGDPIALVTRQGRVVKTAGLPDNMRDTQLLTVDPVAGHLHRIKEPISAVRALDFDKDGYYGVQIDSVFKRIGPRSITILERHYDTILVEERCVARHVNWAFDNRYWADPVTGFPWKSVQHVSRHFDPVDIEVLKPAAPA